MMGFASGGTTLYLGVPRVTWCNVMLIVVVSMVSHHKLSLVLMLSDYVNANYGTLLIISSFS